MHIRKRLSTPAATFLVAASLALPAGAQSGSGDPPSASVTAATIHIENFGRVNATYYRGGQPKGGDYTDLAALGVKTVINLTSSDADAGEQTFVERAGMKYFQIPMTTHQQPRTTELAEFLKTVNDPANQPVFVHCVGGRHRTGVMTAAYRMTHDGWSAAQAFAEMKQYKFGADFLHPEFKAFVYAYHADPALAAPAAAANATSSSR